MNTYKVDFIDGRDGCPNKKIIEAQSADDALHYMLDLGHTDVVVEMTKCEIACHLFDLFDSIDNMVLRSMAMICSAKLHYNVLVNQLPDVYACSEICRNEIDYIVNGTK